MCQFKSALVLKDRIFLPDYDSHDKMLQELGIEDNFTNASKVFVRVELLPTDGNILSAVDGWKLIVNQDILPEWWNEAERLPQLKELVETWMRKHTFYAGKHEVSDGVWLATGSAAVRATGSAKVSAFNGAMVMATDSATVTAYNSAAVRATGSVMVLAFNGAAVRATGSAKVSAYDSAMVRATGSATVSAYNSAAVRATGSVMVLAYDSAAVRATGSATVLAYDSAMVMATDSATVTTYNSATVIIPKRFATDGVIELNDDSVCINHKTHTIRSAIKWK